MEINLFDMLIPVLCPIIRGLFFWIRERRGRPFWPLYFFVAHPINAWLNAAHVSFLFPNKKIQNLDHPKTNFMQNKFVINGKRQNDTDAIYSPDLNLPQTKWNNE